MFKRDRWRIYYKKYGKQTGIKMGELLRKERISWMKKVDEMNR